MCCPIKIEHFWMTTMMTRFFSLLNVIMPQIFQQSRFPLQHKIIFQIQIEQHENLFMTAQQFGLLRDPSTGNNWKIKFTNATLVSKDAVPEIPRLSNSSMVTTLNSSSTASSAASSSPPSRESPSSNMAFSQCSKLGHLIIFRVFLKIHPFEEFFGQDHENENNFSLIVECYYGLDIFSNRASHTYTHTKLYFKYILRNRNENCLIGVEFVKIVYVKPVSSLGHFSVVKQCCS